MTASVSPSKAHLEDLQSVPTFLQEVIDAKAKKVPLSYATATANFISSWVFPAYNRLLNARQDGIMHIFPDKSCVFDYTPKKSGGISGNYPTIYGHKIVYFPQSNSRYEVVQSCLETSYFEISNNGQLQIVEYYRGDQGPSSRTWTVYNPLHAVTVDDKHENCYWGNLVKAPR